MIEAMPSSCSKRTALVPGLAWVGKESCPKRTRPPTAILPDLMYPFDLTLRLGGIGNDEGYIVEHQALLDASHAVFLVPREDACLLDIDLQRQPILHECVVKEMQIGGHVLAAVDGATHLHTTAVVEHVQ